MKSLFIPIHSFVDVITNSSTEVYISVADKTIETVRALVDNLLKFAGSTKTSVELFDVAVVYECWGKFGGEKFQTRFLTKDELVQAVIDGYLGKEDTDYLLKGNEDGSYPRNGLRLTPKVDAPEVAAVCATLSHLPNLFNIEANYNG